jgi:hypothetical protein
VLNRSSWTDAQWDHAQADGLATRRAARYQSAHRWILTDLGLDLFIDGK